jgi:hypothetical protein
LFEISRIRRRLVAPGGHLIVIHWRWHFGLAIALESGQEAKTVSIKKFLPLGLDCAIARARSK